MTYRYSWNSLSAFFETLNANANYVILRNYETIDVDYLSAEHPDIDILCDCRKEFLELTKSVSRTDNVNDMIHRAFWVNDKRIDLDVRCVGDGYYDTVWEREILRSRELYKDFFYIPSPENYYYSLLYHVLFQKRKISPDYKSRLTKQAISLSISYNNALSIDTLQHYMRNKKYQFVYPENPGTIANFRIVDKEMIKIDPIRAMQRFFFSIKHFLKKLFKL